MKDDYDQLAKFGSELITQSEKIRLIDQPDRSTEEVISSLADKHGRAMKAVNELREQEIQKLMKRRDEVIDSAKSPLVFTILTITLCLVLLPFAYVINKTTCPVVEGGLMMIVILFAGLAIASCARFTIDSFSLDSVQALLKRS